MNIISPHTTDTQTETLDDRDILNDYYDDIRTKKKIGNNVYRKRKKRNWTTKGQENMEPTKTRCINLNDRIPFNEFKALDIDEQTKRLNTIGPKVGWTMMGIAAYYRCDNSYTGKWFKNNNTSLLRLIKTEHAKLTDEQRQAAKTYCTELMKENSITKRSVNKSKTSDTKTIPATKEPAKIDATAVSTILAATKPDIVKTTPVSTINESMADMVNTNSASANDETSTKPVYNKTETSNKPTSSCFIDAQMSGKMLSNVLSDICENLDANTLYQTHISVTDIPMFTKL